MRPLDEYRNAVLAEQGAVQYEPRPRRGLHRRAGQLRGARRDRLTRGAGNGLDRRRPPPLLGGRARQLLEQRLGGRGGPLEPTRRVELEHAGGVTGWRDGPARLRHQAAPHGAGEQRRRAVEQVDLVARELTPTGHPDHDHCTPRRTVGDEGAAQLGADAARREQVPVAWAALEPPARRLVQRCRLARRPGQIGEFVDVGDLVLVVGDQREPVGDVLQPVLGDEV